MKGAGEGARIRSAGEADLPAVGALLQAVGLPVDGLEERFPGGYVVACSGDGSLLGVAGVEVYGDAGLLRSVAVADSRRGTGLGRALVEERMRWAAACGLRTVYLLTTTAADFFARLGFSRIERDAVPGGVRGSREFAAVCPVTATVMRRGV